MEVDNIRIIQVGRASVTCVVATMIRNVGNHAFAHLVQKFKSFFRRCVDNKPLMQQKYSERKIFLLKKHSERKIY